MSCTNPIDAAVLADYWLALLPAQQEEALEEHLLACDECGDGLRQVIALSEALRELVREGSLRVVVSDTFVERMAQQGLRVRSYSPPAGGGVQCTVTAEDDFLIAHLAADFHDAKRVDLSMCDASGVEQVRLADIPVRPDATSVVYQESMAFAKATPTSKLIARLVAPDESGQERVLGEYAFNHTRSLPGPGGW